MRMKNDVLVEVFSAALHCVLELWLRYGLRVNLRTFSQLRVLSYLVDMIFQTLIRTFSVDRQFLNLKEVPQEGLKLFELCGIILKRIN
jgi:hypothetical protein